MAEPLLFLAFPNRGSVATGLFTASHCRGQVPVYCLRTASSSLLTLCFNQLWAQALNDRKTAPLTEFVMCHDDLVPIEPGWLDTLYQEYRQSGADILSTIVPIKDQRGLSSTAIYDPDSLQMRRITMTEAQNLPVTFDATTAGYPGCTLLPNTGLWICDFTKPWVEKICFTMRDRVFQDARGEWVAQCFSEDWNFGVQALELGLKVCVTRAVQLVHMGQFRYPNFAPWGTLAQDDSCNMIWPGAIDNARELRPSQTLALAS